MGARAGPGASGSASEGVAVAAGHNNVTRDVQYDGVGVTQRPWQRRPQAAQWRQLRGRLAQRPSSRPRQLHLGTSEPTSVGKFTGCARDVDLCRHVTDTCVSCCGCASMRPSLAQGVALHFADERGRRGGWRRQMAAHSRACGCTGASTARGVTCGPPARCMTASGRKAPCRALAGV